MLFLPDKSRPGSALLQLAACGKGLPSLHAYAANIAGAGVECFKMKLQEITMFTYNLYDDGMPDVYITLAYGATRESMEKLASKLADYLDLFVAKVNDNLYALCLRYELRLNVSK